MGLLFGGQARRLGSPKESLVNASGEKLLEHQLARLTPFFAETFLLCGSSEKLKLEVGDHRTTVSFLADPPQFCGLGPMSGLLAALHHCRTTWLALMPIDAPFFPAEAFLSALSQSRHHKVLGFQDHMSREQWLPGLYHKTVQGSLENALRCDERSLGRWVRSVPHAFLPWHYPHIDAQRAFCNINTLEQAKSAGFRVCKSG